MAWITRCSTAILMIVGSGGMAVSAQTLPPARASATMGASAAVPVRPVAVDPASYMLGSGDKVRIIVYGEDSMTGEYSVTDSGRISFPLIGDIAAGGKSLIQVQSAIRDRLARGYIKDPRVSVEVLNYRPFYILGEVNKPGEYPYTSGLTLQQAVATAGGYTYRANSRRAAVKGSMETTEHRVELRGAPPIKIEPGDTIRILERFF